MKKCSKCQETKELTEFSKNKTTKDGWQTVCKSCMQQSNKKYYTKNTEKIKQSIKKYQTSKQGVYAWFENDLCLYIGQSKRLNSRINDHKSWLKHPETSKKQIQSKLYDQLRNHPLASIRIIEECLPEVLLTREQHYIDTLNPLYNKQLNK